MEKAGWNAWGALAPAPRPNGERPGLPNGEGRSSPLSRAFPLTFVTAGKCCFATSDLRLLKQSAWAFETTALRSSSSCSLWQRLSISSSHVEMEGL